MGKRWREFPDGWWYNHASGELHDIGGDAGQGDHMGFIWAIENHKKLGIEPRHSKALEKYFGLDLPEDHPNYGSGHQDKSSIEALDAISSKNTRILHHYGTRHKTGARYSELGIDSAASTPEHLAHAQNAVRKLVDQGEPITHETRVTWEPDQVNVPLHTFLQARYPGELKRYSGLEGGWVESMDLHHDVVRVANGDDPYKVLEAGELTKMSRGGFLRGLIGAAGAAVGAPVTPGAIAKAAVAQAAVPVVKAAVQAVTAPKPEPLFKSLGKLHPNWASLGDHEKLAHLANHAWGLVDDQRITPEQSREALDRKGPSYGDLHSTGEGGIGLDDSFVEPVDTGYIAAREDPFYTGPRTHVEFHHVDHEGNHTSHKMPIDIEDCPRPHRPDHSENYGWLLNKMERHVKKVGAVK